jgi:hypothetical protein
VANNLKTNPLQLDTVGGTSYYPHAGQISSILFGGNMDTDTTVLMYNVENLIVNGNFTDWNNGTDAAPDHWVLAGADGTVAREATVIRTPQNEMSDPGLYSCLITRAGTNITFKQNVLANFGPDDVRSSIAWWKGRTIMGGIWGNCTTPAQGKVSTTDGVTVTASSDHGGSDAWTWLFTAPVAVNAAATELSLLVDYDTGDDGFYLSGAMLFEVKPIFQLKSTGPAVSISYPRPLPFDGLYLATLTGGVLQVQI